MTLWCPDTCKCEIVISDADDTRGQAVAHLKVCDAHRSLGHDHNDVLAENRRKNYALRDAKEAYPNIEFAWSFDDKRTLILDAADKLDATTKKTLQDNLDIKHGADKVRVR